MVLLVLRLLASRPAEVVALVTVAHDTGSMRGRCVRRMNVGTVNRSRGERV